MKTILLNLTSHPLDMVDAEPNSLDERKVDIQLPVFETLGGHFEDNLETIENQKVIYNNEERDIDINFSTRKFVLSTEEIEKILKKINPGRKYILIVSLPVMLNYKEKIELIAKTYFDLEVKVVAVITATKRHIKPPVACMRYFSE